MATPKNLFDAINRGDAKEVERLIAGGIGVNELLGQWLPLQLAAFCGETEIVKRLLGAGADVDKIDPVFKKTALMHAAESGHPGALRVLLDAEASIELVDDHSKSALMSAASERTKSHLECVRALIDARADVNVGENVNSLMVAARDASPEIVKALLAAGANVNGIKKRGTPLIFALRENRADNIAIPVEAGADVNLPTTADYLIERDCVGMTALEIARKKRLKKIIPLLEAAAAGGQPPAASGSKPAKVPTVSASWKRIDKWLAKQGPDLKKSLQKGATAANIKKLETALGVSLPPDFQESCRAHNGQSPELDLIPAPDSDDEPYALLPLDRIAAEWSMLKGLLDIEEFKDKESGPDDGIRSDWWHPGWIPFASNGGGDYLCLDLAPTSSGKAGQVISMNHESPKRERLADSFAAWLADVADTLDENVEEE